nr:MAG TPA: hypothetical protein [Caudoviricetes sp.]
MQAILNTLASWDAGIGKSKRRVSHLSCISYDYREICGYSPPYG